MHDQLGEDEGRQEQTPTPEASAEQHVGPRGQTHEADQGDTEDEHAAVHRAVEQSRTETGEGLADRGPRGAEEAVAGLPLEGVVLGGAPPLSTSHLAAEPTNGGGDEVPGRIKEATHGSTVSESD